MKKKLEEILKEPDLRYYLESSLFLKENLQKEAAKRLYAQFLKTGNFVDSAGWYISNEQTLTFEQLLFDAEKARKSNISKELCLLRKIFRNNENRIKYENRINIVDLGCGNGNKVVEILDNLPEKFVCYFPIDSSQLMIKIAHLNICFKGQLVGNSIKNSKKYNTVGVTEGFLNSEFGDYKKWRIKGYNDELSFKCKINNYVTLIKTLDKFLESTKFSSMLSKFKNIKNKLDYFGLKDGYVCGTNKKNYEIGDPEIIIEKLRNQLIERIFFIKDIRKKGTISSEDRKFFDLLMKYSEYNSLYSPMWRLEEILGGEDCHSDYKLERSYSLLIELAEASNNFNILEPWNSYYNKWGSDFDRMPNGYFIKNKPSVFSTYGLLLDFANENFSNVMGTIESVTSLKEKTNLVTFLGQTLGNFGSKERKKILKNVYSGLNKGDFFLIGVDLRPENLSEKIIKIEEKKIENQYLNHEDSDFLLSSIKLIGINEDDIKVEVDYKNDTIEARLRVVNDVKLRNPNIYLAFKKGDKVSLRIPPTKDIFGWDSLKHSHNLFFEKYKESKSETDLYLNLQENGPSMPPHYNIKLVTHVNRKGRKETTDPGNLVSEYVESEGHIDNVILPPEFYEEDIVKVFKKRDPKHKITIDSDKKEFVYEFKENVILREEPSKQIYLKKGSTVPLVHSYKFSHEDITSLIKATGFNIVIEEVYQGRNREEYIVLLAQK